MALSSPSRVTLTLASPLPLVSTAFPEIENLSTFGKRNENCSERGSYLEYIVQFDALVVHFELVGAWFDFNLVVVARGLDLDLVVSAGDTREGEVSLQTKNI